jgi:HAMP domain-containing protein
MLGFKNLKLVHKLVLIFVVCFLIFGFTNVYTIRAMAKAQNDIARSSEILKTSEELSKYTVESFYIMRNYALTTTSSEIAFLNSELADTFYRLNDNINELKKEGVDPYSLDLLEGYVESAFEASKQLMHYHDLSIKAEDPPIKEQEAKHLSTIEDSKAKMDGVISHLVEITNEDLERSLDMAKRFEKISYVALLIVFILSIILTFVLVSFAFRPIKDLIMGTGKISKGEVGFKVPVKSDDEIGILTRSFNKMSYDLKQSRDNDLKKADELKKSQKELQNRNKELEKFNKLAVGRELKMVELKKKIRELEGRTDTSK